MSLLVFQGLDRGATQFLLNYSTIALSRAVCKRKTEDCPKAAT